MRSRQTRSRGALLLIVALAAGAALALISPQTPRAQEAGTEDLKDLERSAAEGLRDAADLAQRSRALKLELQALQVSLAGILRKVRNHERARDSIEATVQSLGDERAVRRDALAARQQEIDRALAALERIALKSRAAVLVNSAPVVDSLRGALLLAAAIPILEARAQEARHLLQELDEIEFSIARERLALESAVNGLDAEQQAMTRLVEKKRAVLQVTEHQQAAAEKRASDMAAMAADLRQLMALASDPPGQLSGTSSENAEESESLGGISSQLAALSSPVRTLSDRTAEGGGALIAPVDGKIVARFGEAGDFGVAGDSGKGLVIKTRPGSQVVAPFDGQVVYAGAFRSYGEILIIDHGGRYHTLLAGIDRITAIVGQWVLAGEPVARMNPSKGSEPTLYLELRQTGKAIDPLPWLAEVDNKVRG